MKSIRTLSAKSLRLAGWCCLGGLLAGCQDAELGALQAHLDALRSKPQGQIAALPEMPTYDTASYDQKGRRSPFMAEIAEAAAPVEISPLPDADRPRQPLEAFELDSLKLVGTLTVGGTLSGLIEAPDGRVHRLYAGDYLGRDYGQIVGIEPRALALVETVRDPAGGWTERGKRLEMAEQETDGTGRRQQ